MNGPQAEIITEQNHMKMHLVKWQKASRAKVMQCTCSKWLHLPTQQRETRAKDTSGRIQSILRPIRYELNILLSINAKYFDNKNLEEIQNQIAIWKKRKTKVK